MENEKCDLWKGVYYPDEFINDKHAKTLLCLLFDRIICHFPVSDMVCGGGHGMSEVIFGDSPLVKAGVIELEEEFLLDKVDEIVDDWPSEGGWPKDFDRYVNFQVAAMAMTKCHDSSFVPVTDNPNFKIPALILSEFDFERNAKLQAAAAAIASVEIVLPPIIGLEDEDILRLREELAGELIPFRKSMLRIAPQVRSYLNEGASLSEIYQEAKYVIDTSVRPMLGECKLRIEKETRAFWRKALAKAGGSLPKFIMSWAEKSLISAAVDAVKDISTVGVSAIDKQELLKDMKRQGGFGFLLSLEEKVNR